MASARRHISKSAVVREALENALADELRQKAPAVNWVDRWRGVLNGKESTAAADERVTHVLNKHLRLFPVRPMRLLLDINIILDVAYQSPVSLPRRR